MRVPRHVPSLLVVSLRSYLVTLVRTHNTNHSSLQLIS